MPDKPCSNERIDALDRAVFGHEGRGGLVRLASDNNMLITEHIKECKAARQEAREDAQKTRDEQRRTFWAIVAGIATTIATIIITKLLG